MGSQGVLMGDVKTVEASFFFGEVLGRILVEWVGEGVEGRESVTLLFEGVGETKRWEASLKKVMKGLGS